MGRSHQPGKAIASPVAVGYNLFGSTS